MFFDPFTDFASRKWSEDSGFSFGGPVKPNFYPTAEARREVSFCSISSMRDSVFTSPSDTSISTLPSNQLPLTKLMCHTVFKVPEDGIKSWSYTYSPIAREIIIYVNFSGQARCLRPPEHPCIDSSIILDTRTRTFAQFCGTCKSHSSEVPMHTDLLVELTNYMANVHAKMENPNALMEEHARLCMDFIQQKKQNLKQRTETGESSTASTNPTASTSNDPTASTSNDAPLQMIRRHPLQQKLNANKMDLILDLRDDEYDGNPEGNCGQISVRRIEFGNDATFRDLKARVQSVLKVDTDYQQLFRADGQRLDIETPSNAALSELDLGASNRIIVKHAEIDLWVHVRDRPEKILIADVEDQPTVAQMTLDFIGSLVKTNFFRCYHHLVDKMESITTEMHEYYGGCKATMEAATRQYFFDWLVKHDKLTTPISFGVVVGPKIGGIHPGFTATICHDGTTQDYFIKTHHADLREVFSYILLQQIGIGPECHFYGALPGKSTKTLFIGTKGIPDLTLMEKATVDSPNIRSIILEIHVASSILSMGDVHERNCGYSGEKAWIFDFNVAPLDSRKKDYNMDLENFKIGKPQCVDTLVNARQVGSMSSFAQTITANQRMEFGRAIVQKWKLSDKLDVAVNELMSVKERIRAKGGVIEDTCDFNKYLEGVKHNISLFNE